MYKGKLSANKALYEQKYEFAFQYLYIYCFYSWDPETRMKADEALNHEWIKEGMIQVKARQTKPRADPQDNTHRKRGRATLISLHTKTATPISTQINFFYIENSVIYRRVDFMRKGNT